MTVDELGRGAASALRARVDAVDVPDPSRVVDRFRRRRLARGSGVVAIGVVVVALVAARQPVPTRVHVEQGLPTGSVVAEGWASVPKQAAGLGEATAQYASASSDGVAVVGGEVGRQAAIWWSTDGLRWRRASVPDGLGAVNALVLDGRAGLATGSSGEDLGRTTLLWRTDDAGRTWSAVDTEVPFGEPAPSMGRPFVSGLQRIGGDWVATGGASSGSAGIWTSRDGERWTEVLDADTGGSVDVVAAGDGQLLGYWTNATWRATDPHVWGRSRIASSPEGLYPQTVAPGAMVAFAERFEEFGRPTALLRSTDAGRSWTEERSFLERFPDAHVRRVTRIGGAYVAAGAADEHVAAWTSTDGESWLPLPPALVGSPGGVLQLVVPIDGKVVVLGTAPELDRYYVRGVGPLRCPGSVVVDRHTGADALPAAASHTDDRRHVDDVLRANRARLRREHEHVTGLRVGAGGGIVWDRDEGGQVAVRTVPDFAIEVTLGSQDDCPRNPNLSVDGVPVVFLAP